jgi:hypothetical protein
MPPLEPRGATVDRQKNPCYSFPAFVCRAASEKSQPRLKTATSFDANLGARMSDRRSCTALVQRGDRQDPQTQSGANAVDVYAAVVQW